jgi:hypothetical protein
MMSCVSSTRSAMPPDGLSALPPSIPEDWRAFGKKVIYGQLRNQDFLFTS